ncbi:uncharacterized BrkB/YihY/UPF0761 family membrane protein [Chitinivorax tropicus]|uniref:Uncharacterized BrkB/YihY/UPF0761 family membrane protein n=1 Tax=Chitinivorax tropicus TaxID=714531 RepID=A0A840MMW4_9PROT|nr:hypothetical protein [Chitinivorax tropicus]MBB5018805.1 uncharacterized BrkB/YihY/UPF0761 family membrane protein [Chitinivorax tropicus]
MNRRQQTARFFKRHWLLALFVTALAFLGFGLASFNLITLLQANLALIAEHGWQALQDGALMQLVELSASTLVALLCYLVFKVGERLLVEKLIGNDH